MTIEVTLLDLLNLLYQTVSIVWFLTIVRITWARYPMECLWNCAVFSVFFFGTIAIVAILTIAYSPPEATSLKLVFLAISNNNALFYFLGVVIIAAWLYCCVWLPIYRAIFESDEAKDKRFGIVPTKED